MCFHVNLQHSVSQNEPCYRHTAHSLVSLDASSCQSRRDYIEFHLFFSSIYTTVLSGGPDQDSSVLVGTAPPPI